MRLMNLAREMDRTPQKRSAADERQPCAVSRRSEPAADETIIVLKKG